MKKLFILIVILNLVTNSYCQTVIVVNPKQTNYMGEALKRNAELNLESAKLNDARAERRQLQDREYEKEDGKKQAIITGELSDYNWKFQEKKYPEALIEIDKFINNHSDYIQGYFYRAVTRFLLNDYIGSIADCNKCIVVEPKSAEPYFERGKAKEKLDDLKGALSDYNKSLNLNQTREGFFNRGLLKIKLGKNGCSDLKKAEELGHDDAYEMVKKYCN